MGKFKSYKKDLSYSYSLGAFSVYELLKYQPNEIELVIFHSSFDNKDLSIKLNSLNIPYVIDDAQIEKLASKENVYVIAIFKKYDSVIAQNQSHLVLDNPSNMGNLGTIIRTMLGFNVLNLAIIRPGCDIFDPKVIRASMGALFAINFEYFLSIEEYIAKHKNHQFYPFMLNAKMSLNQIKQVKEPISLIFGNEATGLNEKYQKVGIPLVIKHSHEIDSLNLTNAVSIALYQFFQDKFV